MKKIAVITCLVFYAGCSKQNLPLRNQVHLGMSIDQVWQLYGYDKNEPLNTYGKIKYKLIEESDTGKCIFATHRYWFKNKKSSTENLPYLLTFLSCRLPNYDEVQKEIIRRKELFENDSKLKKELDALCEEYPIEPEHRDTLIELLYIYINRPLPKSMSDKMLIKIVSEKSDVLKETAIR